MYGGWMINSEEIREILGLTWEEFHSPEIRGEFPPADGLSISGLECWRFSTLRDRSMPKSREAHAHLIEELERRYEKRRARVAIPYGAVLGVDISLFSGKKVTASTLCKMKGMTWRRFLMMIDRAEFPEADSDRFQNQKSKWWWATTLVRAFPEDRELINSLGWRYVEGWTGPPPSNLDRELDG